MYYGLYKNIQYSTWQCLIDFGIDRLPIDLLKITCAAGIRVVKNSTVNVLRERENGKSFFDGESWIIVYDDSAPLGACRFTVAHELGHILLGHDLCLGRYEQAREISRKPKSEQQADMFALRLLCPASVIWGLQLHTAEEIERHCLVDRRVAILRAQRMGQLYSRDKFLTDPAEKQLYKNFEKYITEVLISKNG